jgi:hypothetical protein
MALTHQMMQNHCLSIRAEVGYPLFAPANATLAFAAGRKFDFSVGMDLVRHAERGSKDFVYAGWASVTDDAPLDYTLVIRQRISVDVITNVTFWASDNEAPVVILAKDRDLYFELDDRLNLQQRAGRPGRKILQGERRAMERIARGAERLDGTIIGGNAWVKNGGEWVPPATSHESAVNFR